MATILTGFLAASLLPIGDDDEKLALLEGAAADLAKRVESAPTLAYRFALLGLDENALGSDPMCALVADAVTSKWQTIANKIGSNPIQVYRAVVLRALEMVAAKRPLMRHAILLLVRNQPHSATGGAAKAIEAMLAGFEGGVADEVNRVWVNAVDMSLPKLSAKVKKTAGNKDELLLALARAVGPTDKENRPLTTPNPHWPNQGQPWALEYVPRATEAILAAIQTTTKGVADEIQEALRETVASWSDALQRLAIRDAKAELLWIKASLYSPAAGLGYRDLKPDDVALYAALDVSRAVAAHSPTSVEFFLRELVAGQTREKVALRTLLEAIGPKLAKLPEGQDIAKTEEQLPADGRRSWLDFALRPGANRVSFRDQTGVPEAFEEPLPELSVRLFRELQIRKLLAAGS